MKHLWEVWPEAVSREECDRIVKICQQVAPADAQIGFSSPVNNESYRKSIIRWLDIEGVHSNIADMMLKFAKRSNRNNFGFDLTSMNEVQFTEYHGTDNGKYDWHYDTYFENPSPYDRKLSVVIQLSDPREYEGGSFEFFGMQSPQEEFTRKGSVLVFPSFYFHRVLPVTSGTRYSLVTWVEGPKFR